MTTATLPHLALRRNSILLPIAILLCSCLSACSGLSRRTIYVNGPIVTMDGAERVVEGLAVEGDRIAVVGNEVEIRRWGREKQARVVDLEGRAIVPGFIDAHSHFPAVGFYEVAVSLLSPPIGEVRDLEGVVARLSLQEKGAAGEWVMGLGYDDTLLEERRHPTREDLDRVSRQRPVAAIHVSAHFAAVNSVALERLGIGPNTPDPPGGRIQRDRNGVPNGVLEEKASEAVVHLLADPGLRDVLKVTDRAVADYLAAGVTTAQVGFATPEQIRNISWLSRLGRIPLRLVMWPGEVGSETFSNGSLEASPRDPWRSVGAVKLVADGSIQGYTAYLTQPYWRPRDADSAPRGYPRIARERLFSMVDDLHAAGLQIAIHGNGDAAIDDILDAIQAAQRKHPREDPRHVIVHAQMAREDQLDRMKDLGVIPSFFVLHTYYWADRHRDIFLGPERSARISPTGSAARRGMRFTLHADTPVAPMEPLRIVWSAVNRRSTSGAEVGAEQCVSPMRALRAVTIDAAYQYFQEAERGSLEPGKVADLVILDRSPLLDPASIDRIAVLETIVGGRSVYRSSSAGNL